MEEKKNSERKKPLYIPQNALDNDDIISGIGRKEIRIIALIAAIGMIMVIYVFIYHKDYLVLAMAVLFLTITMTIALIHRNRYDESFIDYIKQLWNYRKMQKRYEYRYYNIYEGRYENGETENTGKISK